MSIRSATRHPAPEVLALYARGDLPALTRFRVRTHLLECVECEREVSRFVAATAELKREANLQTLTAFEAIADWNTLEREMLGNIVVGVAAARCIEKVGRGKGWRLKLALAAGLSIVFVGGWLTHIPDAQTKHLISSISAWMGLKNSSRPANMVRATSSGLAVRSEGVTLTILHPATAVVSMSGSSSVEARYVDEDTGQLTITSVYGQ